MKQRTFEEVKTLFHHLISGKMDEKDFDVMMDVIRDYSTGAHTVLKPEPVTQVNPDPIPIPSNIILKNEKNDSIVSSEVVGDLIESNPKPNFPGDFNQSDIDKRNKKLIKIYSDPKLGKKIPEDDLKEIMNPPKKTIAPTQQKVLDIIKEIGHPEKVSKIMKKFDGKYGNLSVTLVSLKKKKLLVHKDGRYGFAEMFTSDPPDTTDLQNEIIKLLESKNGHPVSRSFIDIKIDSNGMDAIHALNELKKKKLITETDTSGSYTLK